MKTLISSQPQFIKFKYSQFAQVKFNTKLAPGIQKTQSQKKEPRKKKQNVEELEKKEEKPSSFDKRQANLLKIKGSY